MDIVFTVFAAVLAMEKYFWRKNFDCKSTYSSLHKSESQSASRFLFFVFSPQKGNHGLMVPGVPRRDRGNWG